MIFFRTFNYLNYILLSRHNRGHGIHSPFVYDLISRVFRNKVDPSVVLKVEQIRKSMLNDKQIIPVCDLGSGSLSAKYRKVSDIARHSPVSRKYGKLLSNMASEFGDKLIVEMGTSLGISTAYMAAAARQSKVITMEGCSETAAIARQNFAHMKLDNIMPLVGPFDELLPGLKQGRMKPGLVFIDGNHRKDPVMKYFKYISEISDSNTVVIIDDINYSAEMNEAWNELKEHSKVSVSIDIFQMGMLFFREGISRISYTIRY